MLISFLLAVRIGGLKTSITEFLALLEALKHGFAQCSISEFHSLARTCLVKDESQYDRFDRVFKAWFDGIENATNGLFGKVPEDWLRAQFEREFSEAEKAKVRQLGSLEELMKQFAERLAEQQKTHQGGNRWIGTNGTSPFGNNGFHPGGMRVGGSSRNRSAAKVWEQRQFANLDDQVELGTRNIKIALRKLRRFARLGAAEELDLERTIEGTARNAGWLDLKFRPERHNAVKVLLFLDVGGSMDTHVQLCEELFSATKSEFKHLEHFYFHNFVYERVWRDNKMRWQETTPMFDVLHKFGSDYRVIFVGDASMAPSEISMPGGSIEHWNEESGATWLTRITDLYPRAIWLNPVPEPQWEWTPSIAMTRELMGERMFPMTLAGLDRAIQKLRA
ncbi:VWA domain-containing protein [Ahniella affigens]|uniref:VWA domain-containing protein n=1 Tax=Ahniella affigens TaxID=2021234 RepID=A0A2P1PW94_9GAMM|nr:VWA domain-containing protein [Ahniella affigens]AVP99054.1 VWA domain-containing protein [Ahniella affigens]